MGRAWVGALLGLLLWATPAGATAKFTGSCSITASSPGTMLVTIHNPITQPGHWLMLGISASNGTTVNPNQLFTDKPLDEFAVTYDASQTATYKAVAEEVNDKTGNGSGDGSGDRYTLLSLDLCSATL